MENNVTDDPLLAHNLSGFLDSEGRLVGLLKALVSMK